MLKNFASLFALLFLIACTPSPAPSEEPTPEATALTGAPLYSPPPPDKLLEDMEQAEAKYQEDPETIDNIVWFGRRTAYPGFYRDAIDIYTRSIEQYPDAPVLYRHRGHRYITVREFDKAIADLERAATLIEGTEDEIEPDGMPNARNIPLTTLHSNIWYHLGLAYYLQQDWENALTAFTKCRDLGLNDDNLVSSTHWIYMILRRMGDEAAAEAALDPIHADMNIIENGSYWKLCRFYQGELSEEELIDPNDSFSANDAVRYGVANWHYYNGHTEIAREQLTEIVEADGWNSFGHIAAEADLVRL
ncbi:tetratricopeptide repeat protein [Flavilitoribacter nigricans]|uniref:Tetratricopeptide repeat protein n=1 Tax=Flavilitoribacter nigricans (strain ATCC 23147 / DSM 23189 / NBRC 102662 / NCIMB 1420 / SS-2) TaxID=1122177 RepID=A0A2D0N179_FLAN2|nr:tetratricopeptide repeat protein [Flavilitoribacter nigricans]PHN02255.1 hypothetical protein CRP01_32670 [Flavilitoribacter nigricans DSM 23189 = NBRC 102662]